MIRLSRNRPNFAETFVRADGAFIPFANDFDISSVTTSVKGVGEIGAIKAIDLQSPINSLISRQVVKVGRSSGLTTGTVMAYALEYNDEKGIFFFADFLVVGKNQQSFDLEGDSGNLILLTGQNGEKPHPMGIIWGGTANRGRLKLRSGNGPENWTSGVDLGRLLDLLELDLITTDEGLQEAMQEQRSALAAIVGSTAGESSPEEGTLLKDKTRDLSAYGSQHPTATHGRCFWHWTESAFHACQLPCRRGQHNKCGVSVHSQPSWTVTDASRPWQQSSNNLYSLRDAPEEVSVSLQLGEREPKRQVFRFHIYLGRPEMIGISGNWPIVFSVIFKRISYNIIGAGFKSWSQLSKQAEL